MSAPYALVFGSLGAIALALILMLVSSLTPWEDGLFRAAIVLLVLAILAILTGFCVTAIPHIIQTGRFV